MGEPAAAADADQRHAGCWRTRRASHRSWVVLGVAKETMRYGSTTKATSFGPPDWRIKLIKAVLFFIPAANPDSEWLYPKVKRWILEVEDDGTPAREVALDEEGRVLFRAPQGRNVGFWTDSDAKFTEADLVAISSEQFEESWTKVPRP